MQQFVRSYCNMWNMKSSEKVCRRILHLGANIDILLAKQNYKNSYFIRYGHVFCYQCCLKTIICEANHTTITYHIHFMILVAATTFSEFKEYQCTLCAVTVIPLKYVSLCNCMNTVKPIKLQRFWLCWTHSYCSEPKIIHVWLSSTISLVWIDLNILYDWINSSSH